MRLLRRLGLDDDVVVIPPLAMMGKSFLGGPGLYDDLEGFPIAFVRFFDRNAETTKLVLSIAAANTEIETPTRQEVEGRGLLSQENGIVPGQHRHRGAQAYPLG